MLYCLNISMIKAEDIEQVPPLNSYKELSLIVL